MKVAINTCFGGFSLSKEAYEYLGIPWDEYGYEYSDFDAESRTDEKLIECITVLGEKANGSLAKLKIVDIPEDVNWYIDDYDGMESVEEVHRSWC